MSCDDWPDDKVTTPKRHGGLGFHFDPGNSTCWPTPDMGDPSGDLAEPVDRMSPAVVRFYLGAYIELMTHPCGVDMLRRARKGWKAVRKAEHEASRAGPPGGTTP